MTFRPNIPNGQLDTVIRASLRAFGSLVFSNCLLSYLFTSRDERWEYLAVGLVRELTGVLKLGCVDSCFAIVEQVNLLP